MRFHFDACVNASFNVSRLSMCWSGSLEIFVFGIIGSFFLVILNSSLKNKDFSKTYTPSVRTTSFCFCVTIGIELTATNVITNNIDASEFFFATLPVW